ncbi:MAG: hypothetical protein ACLTS6_07540 [Anaerobutyricum sp.]
MSVFSKKGIPKRLLFLPIEKTSNVKGIMELPAGRCVCTYHTGDYLSIGSSYERILAYCKKRIYKSALIPMSLQ